MSIQNYKASSLRKTIMNECNDGKGDNGKAYDKKKQQMVGMM
jgi:hypothetical protein